MFNKLEVALIKIHFKEVTTSKMFFVKWEKYKLKCYLPLTFKVINKIVDWLAILVNQHVLASNYCFQKTFRKAYGKSKRKL